MAENRNKDKSTKEHKHVYRESSSEKREGEPLSSQPSQRGASVTRRLAGDVDRTFRDFGRGLLFGSDLWSGFGTPGQFWMPEVETFRRGDQYVIRADLPGLDRNDVHVDVENHTIKISGEREEDVVEENNNFYHSERCYGRFFRSIPVPEGIDEDMIVASFRNGVLEVTLPVPEGEGRGQERRRINVE